MDAGSVRRVNARWTRALAADGEVVWSWRLDPGVKFAEIISQAMVARTADHQGDHEVSRKTIAQGMPDVAVYLWLLRVCTF
jgi:hypothetical protein